jgi:polysaccharide export outer membrane protein
MKNMTRNIVCTLSILCLMVASSDWLFARDTAKQNAKSIVQQPSGNATAVSQAALGSESEPQVRVGPGDLLGVSVFDTPELTQTIRVNELGDASFALIGHLHVGDLTTDEARDALAHKLVDGHFLVNPQVSVLIQEYGTQGVSVLGEVQKPGVYPVLGNRTLLDIISQAGGTTMYAGSSITVKRNSDGRLITIPLTINAANTLISDVRLQPGDKVIIPRASLVYVLGEVGRPGGFLMQNGGRMTVLEAVALAGGQTSTASIGHARLIHKTDSGYTDTHIPLKKIMNGQEPDTELQANDILYVPNSSAKSLIYRTVPGIIQSTSSAAIYGAIF